MILHRVFRADLRRPSEQQVGAHRELLSKLRHLSFYCAQFGNQCLTSNYLVYRHKGAQETGVLLDALLCEQAQAKGRYRDWADKLSNAARDAISRAVSGLIKARGKEVLRGEASLPTFLRRGAIRVRERGVRLWRDGGRLFCALNIEPSVDRKTQWLQMELWVKNLQNSPRYQAVLDRLLDGKYKITQAQLLIVDGYRVSLRFLYSAEVEESPGNRVAKIIATDNTVALEVGDRLFRFAFDIMDAERRKQAIESRRVQCWRLLRGRRLKRRRARIYRSGTLSKLTNAWQNYQRTWCQQLGAAIARRSEEMQVKILKVPVTETLGKAFVSVIEFGQMVQAIENACQSRGITVKKISASKEDFAKFPDESWGGLPATAQKPGGDSGQPPAGKRDS